MKSPEGLTRAQGNDFLHLRRFNQGYGSIVMYGDIVYDYVEQFPAFLGIGKML